MAKILLDMYEDIISLLALLFFNNNAKKALTNLIEASAFNNNNFKINNKLISVPDLITHAKNCVPRKLEHYLGYDSYIKPNFVSNFYLLAPDLQLALLELLKKIRIKHNYFYGTAINLSGYKIVDPERHGVLDFYINVGGNVGQKSVYDYVQTLNNYNAKLNPDSNYLPNSKIVISRFEHLKNRAIPLPNSLYDTFLQILGYPLNIDSFEATAQDLTSIFNQI